MEVIEILPDHGFSYALTEVKRRLICNILCKLFFFFGKELQRNCSLGFLIHHVVILSMLSPGSLSLFSPLSLGGGRDRPWECGWVNCCHVYVIWVSTVFTILFKLPASIFMLVIKVVGIL